MAGPNVMSNAVSLCLMLLLVLLSSHRVTAQFPTSTQPTDNKATITPPPVTTFPAQWIASRTEAFNGMSLYLEHDVYGTDPDARIPTTHPNSSYCSSSVYNWYTNWFDQQTPTSGTETDLRQNKTDTWYRWPSYTLSTVISEPCCQQCWVNAQEIEVLYWPTPAISGAPTSFVSNDVTFVSPSPYIAFRGVTGNDWLCGTRSWADEGGSKTMVKLTTTIPYPESSLSSVLWRVGNSDITTAVPYNFADLSTNIHPECSTNANGLINSQRLTVIDGTSWYDEWCGPHIVRPTGIDNLHPAFKGCSIGSYLEDPPVALTGTTQMTSIEQLPPIPAHTVQNPPAFTSKGIALPSADPFPDSPKANHPVANGQPDIGQSHNEKPDDPSEPSNPSVPHSPNSAPDTKPDPANPLPNSGKPNPIPNPGNPNPIPNPGNPNPIPNPGNPNPIPNPGNPNSNPTSDNSHSSPELADPANPLPPQITPPPFIPAPNSNSIHNRPAGIVLGSHTLLPGASAVTLSNTPISLDPSGVLHVGDATIGLPPITPLPAAQNPLAGLGISGSGGNDPTALPTFEAGGRTFTVLAPTALGVDGQTISAAGAGVVVDGTSIALNTGNELVVGTKTFGPGDITMSTGGVAAEATSGPSAGTNQTQSLCEIMTKGLGWWGVGLGNENATKSDGNGNKECGAGGKTEGLAAKEKEKSDAGRLELRWVSIYVAVVTALMIGMI